MQDHFATVLYNTEKLTQHSDSSLATIVKMLWLIIKWENIAVTCDIGILT